ncbi:MAG: S8 family peptidase [Candidatus Bruticola sp.]
MSIGISSVNNLPLSTSSQSLRSSVISNSQESTTNEVLSLAETFTKSEDKPVSLIIQSDDQEKLASLKAQLLKTNEENKVTAELPIINGFSIDVSSHDSQALANLTQAQQSGVFAVTVDEANDFTANDLIEMQSLFTPADKDTNVMFGVEKLHEQGITGKGTCICVIDSGISMHPDLKDRVIAFKDCVNGRTEPYDDNGHGTHCAGICAGDGTSSGGKNVGVAPEANIVGVKVLDQFGYGETSQIIKGIQWAVLNKNKYDIDVINLSLGRPIPRTRFLDPMTMAVQAAAKCGITVVVSAGNDGPSPGTICSPGNAPSAITVGAFDDCGTEGREDDWPAYFSSVGPTRFDNLEKPDISAPGVDIISCSNTSDGYVKMSGTSMAAPFTAGVAALIKGVNPKIKPKEIKQIIMDEAVPFQQSMLSHNVAGAGAITPEAALAKAAELKK